jgi:hypothetical protein
MSRRCERPRVHRGLRSANSLRRLALKRRKPRLVDLGFSYDPAVARFRDGKNKWAEPDANR